MHTHGLEMGAVGHGTQHLTAAVSIPRYVDILIQATVLYKSILIALSGNIYVGSFVLVKAVPRAELRGPLVVALTEERTLREQTH